MLKASSFVILILAVFIPYSQSVETTQPDQVIELFRHGARGVLSNYDPSWPLNQWGMLTPVGMRQQYILGKVLSEKYPGLIEKAYNYNQIYMITDTTPRCIQSAYAHLYGMYMGTGPSLNANYPPELAIPPFEDARVKAIADSLPDSEALPFNAIPTIVNIVDTSNAFIFQGDSGTYCPNVVNWELENDNDTLAQQAWEIFSETINNVNQYLNASEQLKTGDDVFSFGDSMMCDIYDNRTLPGGFNDPELIRNMTYAYTWFAYHIWNGQQVQKETGSYNIISAMLGQLEAFKEGKTYNTVAMYSGHDDNILAVLAAFGVVNEECIMANFMHEVQGGSGPRPYPNCYFPYFASDIIIEFYNSTETPYVKFYFNNALLPLCNGQPTCSYDEFVAFAKNATGNLTLATYFQACGTNNSAFGGVSLSFIEENSGYGNFNKTLFETISTGKNWPVIGNMTTQTEALIIVGLAFMCLILIAKYVYDRKKYNEIVKSLREERKLYTDLSGIETY